MTVSCRYAFALACLISGIAGIAGSARAGEAAEARTATGALRARLIRDTVYHVVVRAADSTVTVFYGAWPLVTCRWTRIAAKQPSAGNQEMHRVTDRRVWSGQRAVPERVVRVVSATSSAEPEDVTRILPDRCEITLDGGLTLWLMTDRGAAQRPAFGERLRRWIARLNPISESRAVAMAVTPEDAQTLYYALEPGTPVIIE